MRPVRRQQQQQLDPTDGDRVRLFSMLGHHYYDTVNVSSVAVGVIHS